MMFSIFRTAVYAGVLGIIRRENFRRSDDCHSGGLAKGVRQSEYQSTVGGNDQVYRLGRAALGHITSDRGLTPNEWKWILTTAEGTERETIFFSIFFKYFFCIFLFSSG